MIDSLLQKAIILEAVSRESNPSITKLTYGSAPSHRQIVTPIRPLVAELLLEYLDKTYSITEKGRKFLEIYINLVEMLNG